MQAFNAMKRRSGRPRLAGERYPCGKLKPSAGPASPPRLKARAAPPDTRLTEAMALVGPLGPDWTSYGPDARAMEAARLLAAHGVALLARRRTEQGLEYVIRRNKAHSALSPQRHL